MRRYHFDLIDTNSVCDAGGALLDDDDQANKVAQNIALEVRQTRPELVGQGYEVVVRSDSGDELSRTAIDQPVNGSALQKQRDIRKSVD